MVTPVNLTIRCRGACLCCYPNIYRNWQHKPWDTSALSVESRSQRSVLMRRKRRSRCWRTGKGCVAGCDRDGNTRETDRWLRQNRSTAWTLPGCPPRRRTSRRERAPTVRRSQIFQVVEVWWRDLGRRFSDSIRRDEPTLPDSPHCRRRRTLELTGWRLGWWSYGCGWMSTEEVATERVDRSTTDCRQLPARRSVNRSLSSSRPFWPTSKKLVCLLTCRKFDYCVKITASKYNDV